jgi:CcmD family protein
MFFQEPTPDTSGYMIAGYIITFIVMGLYVLSLYLRSRNLHQEMSMLEEMEDSAAKVKATSERQRQKGPAKPAGRKTSRAVTKKSKKK